MKPAHNMLSVRKIAELIELGGENRQWYDHAWHEIRLVAADEQWCPNRFADILALLSPRVSVVRNIRMALQYMGDKTFFVDTVVTVRKAVKTYNKTGVIGGYKVPQFARAIKGDKHSVVLDSWMAKALFATDDSNAIKQFRRKATMQVACDRITQASKMHELAPRDGQACIWHAIIALHKATPAKYSVLSEYRSWVNDYDRNFPASGPIDASGILAGVGDSEF